MTIWDFFPVRLSGYVSASFLLLLFLRVSVLLLQSQLLPWLGNNACVSKERGGRERKREGRKTERKGGKEGFGEGGEMKTDGIRRYRGVRVRGGIIKM